MKTIILTVAEFLILVKVHESEVLHNEAATFIEENSNLTDPEIITGEVTMALPTGIFEDTVYAVEDYKDNLTKDNPERQSVEALLEKLQAVEQEEIVDADHPDEYPGADVDGCLLTNFGFQRRSTNIEFSGWTYILLFSTWKIYAL